VRPAKLFGAGVLGLNEPIPPASAGGSLVLPFAFLHFPPLRLFVFLSLLHEKNIENFV
jgi:hypothetical protein